MGIEAAVAAALFNAGIYGATATAIMFAVQTAVGLVVSFALGALQSAFTSKPKTPNLNTNLASQGLTQNINQAITDRRFVYGEVRVGGALTFFESTSNTKYLHVVLMVADHEVEELGEVWLNDISIPNDHLSASGMVNQGRYNGFVRIKKHLGGAGQVADPDLVAETTATSTFVGVGMAYLYVRMSFDRNKFPSGTPNITVFTKGKKCIDVRDSITRWTNNPALLTNDYYIEDIDSATPGLGIAQADVSTAQTTVAANVSDEFVDTAPIVDTIDSADSATGIITLDGVNSRLQYQRGDRVVLTGASLPGGLSTATDYYIIPYQRRGNPRIKLATSYANALVDVSITLTTDGYGTTTKTAEPRYTAGGVQETTNDPESIISDLLSAMGGSMVNIGGSWFMKAAAYSSPLYSFNEDHILSNMIIRTKVSRRDRFNQVKGIYVSPLNDGEPADYPTISNATYAASDGGTVIPLEHDLAMTQRPHTAMRLAKIKLERHRQELFIEADFMLHAMQVRPGDVVNISNTRMGWSDKPFEVISWTLDSREQDGAPLFFVHMALQETASAVYDWNNGEETTVDPAPNTNLPDPFTVTVVSGFSLDSVLVETQAGDKVFNVKASWVASIEAFVTEGGKYEIEYKETTETQYNSAGIVDGSVTDMMLPALKPDVLYAVRIFAYNNINVKSAETIINNFQVGTTVTTNTEDWENETLGRDGDDWETDTLAAEDWE